MTPYSQGFNAHMCGDTLQENPYPETSDNYAEWRKGWKDRDAHLSSRDEVLDSIGWTAPTTKTDQGTGR